MRIFVDTSAFFALLDRDDVNHKKVKKIWTDILDPENILVTNNYVIVESYALIQSRLGFEAVRGFQEDLIMRSLVRRHSYHFLSLRLVRNPSGFFRKIPDKRE